MMVTCGAPLLTPPPLSRRTSPVATSRCPRWGPSWSSWLGTCCGGAGSTSFAVRLSSALPCCSCRAGGFSACPRSLPRAMHASAGFPVDRLSRQETVTLYYGIGTHWGTLRSQNKKGHVVSGWRGSMAWALIPLAPPTTHHASASCSMLAGRAHQRHWKGSRSQGDSCVPDGGRAAVAHRCHPPRQPPGAQARQGGRPQVGSSRRGGGAA